MTPQKGSIPKDTLEELYLIQGLSQAEIGEQLGRSGVSVSYWLRRHGIPTRSRNKGAISRPLLEHLYCEQELSIDQVAARLDRAYGTIIYWLQKYGIPTRQFKKGPIARETLEELYVRQQLSLERVGEIVGYDRVNVWKWLHRYDIPTRSPAKASVLSAPARSFALTGCYRDNDFFKAWSPEMAWLLGLMFADGNVSNGTGSKKCSLSSIDKDLLEQVAVLLQAAQPHGRRRTGRTIYDLTVGGTAMAQDLIDLGCVPAKSRVMRFPDVPPEFVSHFARGLWDGDGTIMIRSRQRSERHRLSTEVTMQYVSGSKDFVPELRDAILLHTGMKANVKRLQAQYSPYYTINYYHRSSLRILPWLYCDSTPQTRLQRKFLLAQPFMD